MSDESGQNNNLMLMCFVFLEHLTVERMEFNKRDTIYVTVAVTVLGVALLMLCLSYVSNLFI